MELLPENAHFRFYRQNTDKNRKCPKIADRPLIRRGMVDFVMKFLETLPWKWPLPVLLPENRKSQKFANGFK